jgi:hypothetical protein
MATVIIKNQPSSVSAVPGQNTTFSVTPSADFSPVTYTYQWKVNGINISGATSDSYFIDPQLTDNGKRYSVSLSALSAGVVQSTVSSVSATLTVTANVGPYAFWELYPESGEERHTRLRHLGYV